MIEVLSKPKPEPRVKERKPRRPKTARQKLVKQLDDVCRDILLERDGHCVCPTPQKGHYGAMTSGHLITRTKESIRWDLYNLHVQCVGCNGRHENFPHYYTEWFLEKFGLEHYSRLCQDGEKVRKLQLYELEELLVQLKAIKEKQKVGALVGDVFKPYFSQQEILSGAWKLK